MIEQRNFLNITDVKQPLVTAVYQQIAPIYFSFARDIRYQKINPQILRQVFLRKCDPYEAVITDEMVQRVVGVVHERASYAYTTQHLPPGSSGIMSPRQTRAVFNDFSHRALPQEHVVPDGIFFRKERKTVLVTGFAEYKEDVMGPVESKVREQAAHLDALSDKLLKGEGSADFRAAVRCMLPFEDRDKSVYFTRPQDFKHHFILPLHKELPQGLEFARATTDNIPLEVEDIHIIANWLIAEYFGFRVDPGRRGFIEETPTQLQKWCEKNKTRLMHSSS